MKAARISDAVLRETRTITATGKVVGILNGPGERVDITLRLHSEDDVTVHKAD